MAASSPELLDLRREGPSLRARARVPKDLVYLAGHFPGYPVLPGFVELDWVLGLAREQLALAEPLAAIEALKFRSLLLPGAEFELCLEPTAAGLRFALASSEGDVASGRLRFAADLPQHVPQPQAQTGSATQLPLLLPQTGTMRLLERVISDGQGVTLCAARIGAATPLCREGRAPAWLAVELLAQAMAAQGGLAAGAARVRRGFLVGARRIELRTRGFVSGEALWVRAQHLRGETGFVVCECALGSGDPPSEAVSARERALAWGPLKAFVEAPATSATP